LIYHPDKSTGNEEVARRLIEAYTILSYPEDRKKYDRYLNNGANSAWYKQIFSANFWECALEDGRIWWIFGSFLLVVAGIGITIGTAGMALPVIIGAGCAAGALMTTGITLNAYLMSDDCAVNGIDKMELLKRGLISATLGAAGGALAGAASGITVAATTTLGGVVANATVQAGLQGLSIGTSTTVSNGITSGKYQELIEERDYGGIAIDVGIGAVAGLVGGAALGAVASGICSTATQAASSKIVNEVAGDISGVSVSTTRSVTGTVVELIDDGTQAGMKLLGIGAGKIVQTGIEKAILSTQDTAEPKKDEKN